jgi:hypothetical protein
MMPQSSSTRSSGSVERPVAFAKIICSSAVSRSPIAAMSSARQDAQLSPARTEPSKSGLESAVRMLINGLMRRSHACWRDTDASPEFLLFGASHNPNSV